QMEMARAAEAGYLEKIERLRSANADSQEALGAARKTCDGLTEELAAPAMSPQDAAATLMQREENAILRQKLSEIGTAIIRAAGGPAEATAEEGPSDAGLPEQSIPEKATA